MPTYWNKSAKSCSFGTSRTCLNEMTSWFRLTDPRSDDVFVIVIVFVISFEIPSIFIGQTCRPTCDDCDSISGCWCTHGRGRCWWWRIRSQVCLFWGENPSFACGLHNITHIRLLIAVIVSADTVNLYHSWLNEKIGEILPSNVLLIRADFDGKRLSRIKIQQNPLFSNKRDPHYKFPIFSTRPQILRLTKIVLRNKSLL
jgi:hypothetical protein